jgi:hypothetical protein
MIVNSLFLIWETWQLRDADFSSILTMRGKRKHIWTGLGTCGIYLFWTLERECARILWEGTPLWGWGDQDPQWGPVSVSWVRTGEVRRRDEMTGRQEDDPITASRNDHAQSKCQREWPATSVNTHHSIVFIVLLFQENKSYGDSTICIHPLMYMKPCREQFIFSGTPEDRQPTDDEMRTTARTKKAMERKMDQKSC